MGKLGKKLRECRLRWLGHVEHKEEGYVGRRVRNTTVERRSRESREEGGRTATERMWKQWG